MENQSVSLEEELGKPVENIQSSYITRKINSLDSPELEDLVEIKRLVSVERAILDETDKPLSQIIEDETERRKLKFLVGKEISGYPHISKKYKQSLRNIKTHNLPKEPREIQSDIVAKGVVKNGFDSSKSRALVQLEQQVLGEKDYAVNSFAGPRYAWSNEVDRRHYYRVYRELKPKEFEEENYSGRYEGWF